MREVYQNEEDANVVDDTLEVMVREGARRMLAAALEEEVSAFLGRDRYERGDEFRGYRNGYHRSRELTVGVSAVEVKAPRVSDVPAEVSPDGFESKLVRRYESTSQRRRICFGSCTWRDCPPGSSSLCFVNWWERLRAESERDREAEAAMGRGVQVVARQNACRVQVRLHLGRWCVPGSGSGQGEVGIAVRGGSEGGRS